MPTRLYYWTGLPGRGELVRWVLEEAGVDWVDVARTPAAEGGGVTAILPLIRGEAGGLPPLAPPVVALEGDWLAQTTAICATLAERHGLAPAAPLARAQALQLSLSVADLFSEAHDTHHPVATGEYYEDQREESARAARHFVTVRLPRFLDYFERVLAHADSGYLLEDFCYSDLALAQAVRGLHHAFPRAMAQWAPPRVVAHAERIASRPRIAAWLANGAPPFSSHGIFRHYPELDLRPWQRLEPRSETFVAARDAVHQVTQLVAACAHTHGVQAADLSHTTLRYDPDHSALVGTVLADGSQVAVSLVELALLRLVDGEVVDRLAFPATLEQAWAPTRDWLEGQGLHGALERAPHPHPEPTPMRASDAGLAQLHAWFADASEALEPHALRPGASAARIWPHHFDIAVLHSWGEASLNLGMTPGDGLSPEPYFYAGPWPRPDAVELPTGPGKWHAGDFFGATLSADALPASAQDQRRHVRDFLEGARVASMKLLGLR